MRATVSLYEHPALYESDIWSSGPASTKSGRTAVALGVLSIAAASTFAVVQYTGLASSRWVLDFFSALLYGETGSNDSSGWLEVPAVLIASCLTSHLYSCANFSSQPALDVISYKFNTRHADHALCCHLISRYNNTNTSQFVPHPHLLSLLSRSPYNSYSPWTILTRRRWPCSVRNRSIAR